MITIVIHSYKYGHLAGQCIESLLSQNYKPEKILFIDCRKNVILTNLGFFAGFLYQYCFVCC